MLASLKLMKLLMFGHHGTGIPSLKEPQGRLHPDRLRD